MSLTVSLTFSDEDEGRAFAAAAASFGRVTYDPGAGSLRVLSTEIWPSLKSVTRLATTFDGVITGTSGGGAWPATVQVGTSCQMCVEADPAS